MPQALDDPDTRRSITACGQRFGNNQLAVACIGGMRQVDKIFAAIAAVGRSYPSTVMDAVEDADDAV